MKSIHREVQVMSQLDHERIVKYFGSEVIGCELFIYLEYLPRGSIKDELRRRKAQFCELEAKNYMRHILEGLAYLHEKKIIHRDIKGAASLLSYCSFKFLSTILIVNSCEQLLLLIIMVILLNLVHTIRYISSLFRCACTPEFTEK